MAFHREPGRVALTGGATSFAVRPAAPGDAADWLVLRLLLWPEGSEADHRRDIAAFFQGTIREPEAVLLAVDAGALIGIAELSIRAHAEGCSTDRVCFLEGWYVLPAHRRRGVGRSLVHAAEDWGRSRGCTEFGSDTQPENVESIRAHSAVGFENAGTIVCFSKRLSP